MADRPTYEITASDGRVFHVEADDDAQAQRVGEYINSRIAAGDHEIRGGTPPDNAVRHQDLVAGEAPSSSTLGAFGRNFTQGGYLNFADELMSMGDAMNIPHAMAQTGGAIAPVGQLAEFLQNMFPAAGEAHATGLGDLSSTYEANMNQHEAQAATDSEQHPVASNMGEIAGVIANLMATRGAGSAATNVAARVAPRLVIPAAARAEAAMIGAPLRTAMARGAVQGGAYGGTAAAGAGRGNRAQSAAIGALTGAAAGAALDTGVSALIPAIGRYAGALFGRVPHEEAMAQIIQSLRRDGFDLTRPANVQALRAELSRFGGRPVSLADVGAATRARAGVGLRSPSDVQQQSIDQVLARAQGQGPRLRRDVLSNVAPRTDVHALDEQLVAQRGAEAERLRQAALYDGGAAQPQLPDYSPGADTSAAVRAHTAGDEMFSQAVRDYIRDPAGFRPRGRITADAVRNHLQGLDTYIGNNTLTDATTLHRGMVLTPEEHAAFMASGELPHPSSFSRDPNIARDYADPWPYAQGNPEAQYHPTMLELNLGAGSPAAPVDHISGDALEELLLPRGRVTNMSATTRTGADGPYTHITGGFEPHTIPGAQQTRVIDDPIIRNLVAHPDMRRALPDAVARSRSELELLKAQGLPTEHLDAGVFNADQYQALMEGRVGPLDMRTLDMLKRHLDDEVNTLYRRGQSSTFSAGEAHQVRGLRDALRNRMREVNPEYGQYLDQYAGSSDMIDALHAGRGPVPGENNHGVGPGFDRLDPERIASEQAARSTAAQELYRVGAARRLTDVLGDTTDGRNPATRILNSPEAREQLDALGLQPGAADALNTAVNQERQLNLLPAELANSATDARAAARADAEITPNVPHISGNPINWAGAGLRWAANHFGTQRMAGVNAEALPRLLETDPNAIGAIIDELQRHGQEQLAASLRRHARGSRTSRGFAGLIGAPVALPTQPEDR